MEFMSHIMILFTFLLVCSEAFGRETNKKLDNIDKALDDIKRSLDDIKYR